VLPNFGVEPDARVRVEYYEGADVGYRWYAKTGRKPLFPFGHGLSYSAFSYDHLRVSGGATIKVQFDVHNIGAREGADVPQIYLTRTGDKATFRLIGFERVSLSAGESRLVSATVDPRLLGQYDEKSGHWIIPAGRHEVSVGHSSGDLTIHGEATLNGSVL